MENLTDRRGEERGDWIKESEEISQRTSMHSHGHRQQCGQGQGKGVGAGWRQAKREKMRDICNSVNNKENCIVILEVREYQSSNFALRLQYCVGYSGSFASPHKLRTVC